MDYRILPEFGQFITELRFRSLRSADPCYSLAVWCLIYNTNNCTLIDVTTDACFGIQKGFIPIKHTLFKCLNQNTVIFLIKCQYNKI